MPEVAGSLGLWVHITFAETVPDTDELPGCIGWTLHSEAPAGWDEVSEEFRCEWVASMIEMAARQCTRAGYSLAGATWSWEER